MVSGAKQIRVSVADTGEGLSPGQLGQLFQPFNRLGSEARAAEGAGIGLVICKRLVELMGGSIGARSTVGIGSVFWVDLRAANELPWVGVVGDSVPVSSARADADVRTVLYVEDNPANLLLVEDLIARRPDVRLLCATDATTGVAIAKRVRPDVVLMDINLPGISGVDALIELAADPETAAIPVIALSANAGSRDIAECLKAGFFSYITKPIKIAEFMNTLTEALQAAASGLVETKARERPT